MKSYKGILVFSTACLLTSATLMHPSAHAAGASAALAGKPGGFITEAVDPLKQFCMPGAGGIQICPPSLKGGVAPQSLDKVTADLPHLRLDILLMTTQNTVVAGAGIGTPNDAEYVAATFRIISSNQDDTIPTGQALGYQLLAPAPGETASYAQVGGAALFSGIINNGCLNPPAAFDLTLESSIKLAFPETVYGDVHLTDSVQGHGYYHFKYTIRARDDEGNISDFVFSGDANAYCTAQSNFSDQFLGVAPTAGIEELTGAPAEPQIHGVTPFVIDWMRAAAICNGMYPYTPGTPKFDECIRGQLTRH